MFDTLMHYGSVALAIYKALALVVIILSILGIAYVAVKSAGLRRTRRADIPPPDRILSNLQDTTNMRWRRIVERLGTEKEKDFKTAIIEADGLVDAALRAHGFPGETMGERMKAIPASQGVHMNDLWRAHKVRNEIAHDPHYVVSPREGHDIMKIYKKALEDLGAL